jgi:hypothetical protein
MFAVTTFTIQKSFRGLAYEKSLMIDVEMPMSQL